MHRFVFCLGLLLAWPLAAQTTDPTKPASVEFGAGAWVDVDATGKAHVVEMDKLRRFKDEDKPGSLADAIKERLRERIEAWEFTPPTKNGVAVSGKTHVRMSVEAYVAGPGSIGLRIGSANTGMVWKKRLTLLPLFDELGMSDDWWLKVHLKVGPEGRVVEARAMDSNMFHGDNPRSRDSLRLAKALREAFRDAEFETEWVDGQRIAGEGILPISVCMYGKACKVPDEEPGKQGEEEDFAAVNPAVKLITAVAGTVL